MSQHVYRVRRAFVIPLGVDAFLLLCLLAISFLLKTDSTEKLVFAIFFSPCPVSVPRMPCSARHRGGWGVTIKTLWKKKAVAWAEITHVGCLCLHRKTYLLLTTVKGIFIISNAYEEFPAVVETIVERVGLERVEEEVRLQSGHSRAGIANIVSAWVAAAFMVGIILMKMLPFFK